MGIDKNTIEEHFSENIARIQHLVERYEELSSDDTERSHVPAQDLLRSAVVFLHAALEDVIRSLALWKLSTVGDKEALRDVGLPGNLQSSQFHLGHLTYHRGKTVDELLEEAVNEYLEESNFNHPGEIKQMLERCGLDSSCVEGYESGLHPMMKRRHWIVHRMDRNYDVDSEQPSARSLDKSTVETWKHTVSELVDEILRQV